MDAHAPAVPTVSAGQLKSSPSASNAECGGHRASRTRRSAVEAHAPAVPTGSAGQLKSSPSASNAEWRPPSSVTHEAISRQGTHPLCRPARPGG